MAASRALVEARRHAIPVARIALRGEALLTNPRFNKGTCFTHRERQEFGLTGRLPSRINSLKEQVDRAYEQLSSRHDPLRRNSFLQSLKDQNWVLYYALVSEHLKELVPIIYTPTQADAIAQYSHLFRRSEGLYLTFSDQETMEEEFVEQTVNEGREIDLVVCTDAEAILGIGDQGVGGIAISTAKSIMYTLIGGLDPARSLSVMLDVGTDNEKLLNDRLYVGWKNKRIRGEEYDQFVDKFIQLVRKYYPHSLLHFEDFAAKNAYHLLMRYKKQHAVFNDDIQGTGAVTLACLMAAIGVANKHEHNKKGSLASQRYVIMGAGSAGLGIATQIRDAIVAADKLSKEEANDKFWLIDREGLVYDIGEGMAKGVGEVKGRLEGFVRNADEGWNGTVQLLDVVKKIKPTVLIGCSTAAGAFTQEVIQAMVDGGCERPIVFPLSNPSRLVEAKPEDIMKWTKGKALVATGSPFPPVKMKVDEVEKEFTIAECNNALIYPGLGFGAVLAKAKEITDEMIVAGAHRLAELSPAIQTQKETSSGDYEGEALLPDFAAAPKINFEIGVAVAEQVIRERNSDVAKTMKVEEVRDKAKEKVWVPLYADYEYDPKGTV
ncbi:NAD-dependent malic enzyme, mitochondrial [Leucoagaricus sp. SymC.cos]|nr:NAD-dependent malic enzyme, mitochondrial [Leucoagaricus sp. SymC.cos]